MALFDVPIRPNRSNDTAIAKKANKANKAFATTIKGGGGILGRISEIKAMVEQNLGKYKDEYIVIQSEEVLHNYITACVENGDIAIDTETTGLDPMQDKIVGMSIYTKGQKAAYIPINHVSYVTGVKADGQLSVEVIRQELQRLVDNDVKVIMFNANFDIRVIRNQIGVYLKCYWDCYLASRLLNENEPNKGLKKLHQKYVLNGEGDAFKFVELFKGISFDLIPIQTGYLYAAHDAIITYEYYEYQRPFLTADNDECIKRGLQDVSWVFFNIEMPCVEVVCDMEDNGITIDLEYDKQLSEKYNALLEEKTNEFYKVCGMYDKEIEDYKAKNSNHKLSNPINISSPTQLAVLLYDILGIEPVDKKSPRGTGVDVLEKIDNPICKAVLEYRGMAKLISTYIDKLPECVNPKDGRVHCNFNQYGANTGRFSSSDPRPRINWGLKIRLIQGRAVA
jgi:DNA polymerase I-like protein with 3'-5' exonuclease and polymerase domains